jgi:hypothetical protein
VTLIVAPLLTSPVLQNCPGIQQGTCVCNPRSGCPAVGATTTPSDPNLTTSTPIDATTSAIASSSPSPSTSPSSSSSSVSSSSIDSSTDASSTSSTSSDYSTTTSTTTTTTTTTNDMSIVTTDSQMVSTRSVLPMTDNAAIIGGAVGGSILCLLLIGLLALIIVRRRNKSPKTPTEQTPTELQSGTPQSSPSISPRTDLGSDAGGSDGPRSSQNTEYGVISAVAPPSASYAHIEAQPYGNIEAQPYQKVYSTSNL